MPWYAQGNSTTPSAGKFTVRYLDYDGTVLLQRTVDSGWSVAPPATPVHAGLTFAGWSDTALLVNQNMDIIANYTVDDNKTHVFVDASTLAGLTPTLKFTKSDTQALLVEWGDGTTSTTSASGAVTIVKGAAYTAGSYEIKVSCPGVFSGGHGTTDNPMVAGVAVTSMWIRDAATSIPEYMCNGAAFRTMRTIVGGAGVTSIGANAFQYCSALVSASFPLATSIGENAFQGCYALVSASFPSATSVGASAFQYCYALVSASFPSATSIGIYAFQYCYALVSASFPSATSVGASAFQYCYALVSASFPSATSVGANAFQSCYALVSASFPSATSVGASAFQSCRVLVSVIIGPNCTLINALAFDGCRNLLSVTIQAATPPTLTSANAFADYDPRMMIYVPAASLAAYQSATKWSAFASRIVAIA